MAENTNGIAGGLEAAVGGTPLIKLRGASRLTGCTILGKAEFMNPGGSVKDRAALAIITDAERRGALQPGGVIVEGTAGNTGIGLTLVGNARGYRTVIVMPETQSREKIEFLRMIGADLRLVPAKPFRDPGNYVHVARRLADEMGAFHADQFDNLANRAGHRNTTGREILEQTGGAVHAFTCACGTGGTLAGVTDVLKAHAADIRIILADPDGSGLYGWVKSGDLSVAGSSITEGIGQSRVPGNLEDTAIDDAVRVSDARMLPVVFDLLKQARPVGRRLGGFERRGGDRRGAADGAGPHDRYDFMRRRRPLPKQAVQSRIPARQGLARAGLAMTAARPMFSPARKIDRSAAD
jgi:cysteine synthase A